MTDEELAAIKARIAAAWELPGGLDVLFGVAEQVVREDIPTLLADVDHMRELLDDVASGYPMFTPDAILRLMERAREAIGLPPEEPIQP